MRDRIIVHGNGGEDYDLTTEEGMNGLMQALKDFFACENIWEESQSCD